MKRFTKICLILALVFIVIGMVFGIISCSTGATRATFWEIRNAAGKNGWGNWFWFWNDTDGWIPENLKEEKTEEEFYAADIREFVIDVRTAKITICDLSEYDKAAPDKLIVEKQIYGDLQEISTTMENGRLLIQESDEKSTDFSLIKENQRAKIKIYLPDPAESATLNIESLKIENGIGDLKIEQNMNLALLEAELGVGDINISGELQINGDAALENGTGDIRTHRCFCNGKLTVTSGVGDVEITGKAQNGLRAESGTGDMKFYLLGDPEAYSYQISNGTGDLTVNGKKYEGVGHEIHESGHHEHYGSPVIDIDGGVGDIDVEIH